MQSSNFMMTSVARIRTAAAPEHVSIMLSLYLKQQHATLRSEGTISMKNYGKPYAGTRLATYLEK